MTQKPQWDTKAQSKLKEVPFLFRGAARKFIEKEAQAQGVTLIDMSFMEKARAKRNAEKNKS